jgi:hypothetical protein
MKCHLVIWLYGQKLYVIQTVYFEILLPRVRENIEVKKITKREHVRCNVGKGKSPNERKVTY